MIIADLAVLDYAATKHPDMEIHLSVQASATNSAAIQFYKDHFNVKRVVLPRVLSIHQVKQLARTTDVDLEVFAFGSLCIMSEGRCYLSSYMTGESPNTVGACSPAKYVRWQETPEGLESRLNDILIDRYKAGENAGYPTLCKGRFVTDGEPFHALEEPTSLNTLSILPELFEANIASVKIEGRQRSPAYVEQVTRTWRQAIDSYKANPEGYQVLPQWNRCLDSVSEARRPPLARTIANGSKGASYEIFTWPTPLLLAKKRRRSFYQRAVSSDADIVYLGETVCSKRREMRAADWMILGRELAASGKQVVLSTMALLEAPSEVNVMRSYIDNGEFIVEANDVSAIQLAHEKGIPFVAGPALNLYNAQALQVMLKKA